MENSRQVDQVTPRFVERAIENALDGCVPAIIAAARAGRVRSARDSEDEEERNEQFNYSYLYDSD